MFNATFNNISVISWRLVLFVEKPWVSKYTMHYRLFWNICWETISSKSSTHNMV